MPQFDFSSLSVVLFSSLISVGFYYSFLALNLLPEIILNIKFRIKKLYKKNVLNLNFIFLPNLFCYGKIVQLKNK
jgi:hypothetical protein